MQLKLGDIVVMKKAHPCGSKEFEITRLGVDYAQVHRLWQRSYDSEN